MSHVYSEIKCERCGGKFEEICSPIINASEEPLLKDAILRGEIYNYTCPHCHKDILHIYPILYHDKERKTIVYGSTEDGVFQKKLFVESIMNSSLELSYQFMGSTKPSKLVENVICLENEWDPNVMELYKLAMRLKIQEKIEEKSTKLTLKDLYMEMQEEKPKMVVMLELNKKVKTFRFNINQNLYLNLEKKYKDEIKKDDPLVFQEEEAFEFVKIHSLGELDDDPFDGKLKD